MRSVLAGIVLTSFSWGVFAQAPPSVPGFSAPFDFSGAGYHGGKSLPSRETGQRKIFRVVDFGALPNDGKDDIDAIQAAVDSAEKAGGGLVLFPPGTFDFDVETSRRFVRIQKSGIVIRGYGDGPDGTILHDHHPSPSPDPTKKWLGGRFPSFFQVGTAVDTFDQLPVVATLGAAPSGSRTLTLKEKPAPAPGLYLLTMTNPPDTSLTLDLVAPLRKPGSRHCQNRVQYAQMVRVETVEGNQVRLQEPIHWKLETRWNPCLRALPEAIRECGIENFRLVTDWKEEFHHHKNDIHDSGWDHIHFSGVENGWVRNITHDSPSAAVVLTNCYHCVVYDCQIRGNRGHNGFILSGASTSNLLMRLKGGSTMHTVSMSGFCSGNVWYLIWTREPASLDCHGSLCHHNLVDNAYGLVVQNGGGPGAVPPAHARHLVLYNLQTGTENAYNFRIQERFLRLRDYPGLRAYGVRSVAGFDIWAEDEKGKLHRRDVRTPFGQIEQLNYSGRLPISSLYLWQREKRGLPAIPVEER